MDKDIKLGNNADLDISISGIQATVKLSAHADIPELGASFKSENSASITVAALANKLFDAIEKASPAGMVAIEEGAKQAVLAGIAKLTS